MNPCQKCTGRYPGCQSHCELPEHLAYDERESSRRKMIAEAKRHQGIIEQAKGDAIRRTKRLSGIISK